MKGCFSIEPHKKDIYLNLLTFLKYDHVLECLGSFALPNIMEVWLISPLMEMGSVRKILDSHFPEGIPESAASPIIRDILLGLVHLHERGIVHRALKVNNKHYLKVS